MIDFLHQFLGRNNFRAADGDEQAPMRHNRVYQKFVYGSTRSPGYRTPSKGTPITSSAARNISPKIVPLRQNSADVK
jgi:hypothetical protein